MNPRMPTRKANAGGAPRPPAIPLAALVLAVGLWAALAAPVPAHEGPHPEGPHQDGTTGVAFAPLKVELKDFGDLGGDFTLTGPAGKPVSLSAFRGKAALLFFGYTHCPDVCPAQAATIQRALKKMGKEGEQVRVFFITTDPARDTPTRLKEFLYRFGPQFIGLTGKPDRLAEVEKRYGAGHWREGPAGKGGRNYLVNHTARIFLLDPKGRVRFVFPAQARADDLAKGVRLVLAERSWFSWITRWFRS